MQISKVLLPNFFKNNLYCALQETVQNIPPANSGQENPNTSSSPSDPSPSQQESQQQSLTSNNFTEGS